MSLPEELGDVELVAAPVDPAGTAAIGVVKDRRGQTFTATLGVRVRNFALLSDAEQERRLAAYGTVLAGLARDDSVIRRVGWVERTVPNDGDDVAAYLQQARDPALALWSGPVASYIELIESAADVTQDHELFVSLQLDGWRARAQARKLGPGDEGMLRLVVREVELFARRLEGAGVQVLGALPPRVLAKAIRDGYDPFGRSARARAGALDPSRNGTPVELAGPQARETTWSTLATDSAVHVTYWVSEWPRIDVGAVFLQPLLMQTTAVRTVAMVMDADRTLQGDHRDRAGAHDRHRRRDHPPTPRPGHHRARRRRRRRRPRAASRSSPTGTPSCATPPTSPSPPAPTIRRAWIARARRSSTPPSNAGCAWSASTASRTTPSPSACRCAEDSHDTALARATERSRRLVQTPVLPRVRARAMPAQRSGHRVSSAHLQAAYPFVAEGGLGSRGVYVGRDLHGGSFVYDPWELYGRELTDPNMVLVGHVGSAKSSLVKTLIYRQHVFGRVARVIDVKREYAPLAHALGGTVIQLRPGGTVRLNPLTPLAGPERQLELLRAVTIATLHRRLSSEEDAALRVALNAVTARLADAEATLPDVVAALLAPTGEMADALVTTPRRVGGRGARRGARPRATVPGRPARDVRRPHHRGPRLRRAGRRARPRRRLLQRGAGHLHGLRHRLHASHPHHPPQRRRRARHRR